jgi:hypothetical protein
MSYTWTEWEKNRYQHFIECEFYNVFDDQIYCSCWSEDHFCKACYKVFYRDCGSLVIPHIPFHADEPETRREKEFRTRKLMADPNAYHCRWCEKHKMPTRCRNCKSTDLDLQPERECSVCHSYTCMRRFFEGMFIYFFFWNVVSFYIIILFFVL